MIDLHFHWAWILFFGLIIAGIIAFFVFSNDNDRGPAAGLSVVVGCGAFLFALVLALVVGGIWLW